MDLYYNLGFLLVDGAILFFLKLKRNHRLALSIATLSFVFLVFVSSFLFAQTPFAMVRLWAYGVFLHGCVLLLGTAWIVFKQNRTTALGFLSLALLLEAIAVDAFWIEPHLLEVSRVTIETGKLKTSLKIVVLADLQTDEIGAYERKTLLLAKKEKPDLILFLGDYVQAWPSERQEIEDQLHTLLKEINLTAPLGVFAVGGNTDDSNWQDIFKDLEITCITQSKTLEVGSQITLTGLDLEDSGHPETPLPKSDKFHIVFGHRPDFALFDIEGDLLIAGHTHGGQFQLPFIGPLITLSRVPRSWASGVSKLTNGSTLVVSRGIGMERLDAPRLRFLCRPEIVVIEVGPLTD